MPISKDVSVIPQFIVPTSQSAIAHVNRWLHQQIGTALHAATGQFAGHPQAELFQQRAEALAAAHGIE